MGKNNQQFSSVFGFLIVIIGFAIGVGTLWRFPYMMGSNGGAIFLFFFILIILIIGIPLLTAEITIGYSSKKTAVKAYKTLTPNKKWHLASYLHIAAAFFTISYTVPVYSWILDYIYKTAINFFAEITPSEYFPKLVKDYKSIFLFATLNWIMLIAVLRGGLQGGVERISKILLPLLAVIMIIIIILGLRLPNSSAGIEYLFKPDISKFTFKSLLAALGQAFFAIGIGMLASMVFGSYMKNKTEKIIKHANIICIAIIIAGIAAGLMIFPFVFAFNLDPSSGPGLTFITLPYAFNQITGGIYIGVLFYIGFYIAAFTSAIGVAEAIVGVVMDELNISRNKAIFYTMTLVIIIASLSILYEPAFSFLDNITSNYLIVLGALAISIYTGYIWGIDNFLVAANVNNKFLQLWLRISIKYIAPILIIVLFIAHFFDA